MPGGGIPQSCIFHMISISILEAVRVLKCGTVQAGFSFQTVAPLRRCGSGFMFCSSPPHNVRRSVQPSGSPFTRLDLTAGHGGKEETIVLGGVDAALEG